MTDYELTLEQALSYITNPSVSNVFCANFVSSTPSPDTPSAPEVEIAGRRSRRKDARPGELLDAALALFVEKGFAATRVEQVAARAGVSKGTLFLYFQSKEDLFKAVVRENIAGRFTEWGEEMQQFKGSTAEMLRCCYQAWWDRIGNTPASGIAKLMLGEAGNFPALAEFYQAEVVVQAQALVRGVLARGVQSGEFRAVNLDYAVHSVIAPLLFLMMSKHSAVACMPLAQHFDPQVFLEQQLDSLLYGLCPRAAAG